VFAAFAGVALAPASAGAAQSGISSVYAAEHGSRTASGTKLKDRPSAHRSGSKVRVVKRSGKSGVHSTKRGTKTARGKRLKNHAAAHRSAGKVRVAKRRAPAAAAVASQNGIASVYSTKEGTRTASGIRLSDHALTAAHRSLPFGSKVHVTNHKNGKSVVVTITDRGPFIRGRIIDLTPAGARALGFNGLAPVPRSDCNSAGRRDSSPGSYAARRSCRRSRRLRRSTGP
jgi:rare lipoprotein A